MLVEKKERKNIFMNHENNGKENSVEKIIAVKSEFVGYHKRWRLKHKWKITVESIVIKIMNFTV